MPTLELTRTVTVALDELVGIDDLERAAVELARTAPAALIASAIEAMVAELVTEVCGPFGMPVTDEGQITAPWACPECGSRQGFRRRGTQVRQRGLTSQVGQIKVASKMIYCRSHKDQVLAALTAARSRPPPATD